MKKCILLCCHGTRNTEGIKDTIKLLKIFRKKNKGYVVKIGYLEIVRPTIENQLNFFFRRNFDNLLIIPCMIFSGNHVTKDIPKIINISKKRYKILPKIFISPPLFKSKNFFKIVQSNLNKNLRIVDRKKKNGLIVVTSYTINTKAKSEMNLLAKKIAKNNKINFYKKILITLNKENLKQQLRSLNLNYDSYLILPIFLFKGNLLENLISVIKDINKKNKNKFILCSHLNNYKNVYNSLKNITSHNIT